MLRNTVVLSVVVLLAVGGAAQAGLVSHWKLDDTGTDANPVVDSVSGNDGTSVGTMTRGVAGQFGTAFQFDGVNDYINFGDLADFEFAAGESFTIAGWYSRPLVGTGRGMLGKGDGGYDSGKPLYYISTTAGAAAGIRFWLRDTSGGVGDLEPNLNPSPIATYFDGSWHHVAGVYDGSTGTATLYVDGAYADAVTDAAATAVAWGTNSEELWAGSDHYGFIDGKLDDLAIWDEALDTTQLGYVISSGAENYNIPEPASAVLLLLGLPFVMRRKRR